MPVQSDKPVGPVGSVPTNTPPDAEYQFWPGNLHTALTEASNWLEMDTAALEPACDFGSLSENDPATGDPYEFDLSGDSADGTYCSDGGLIKLSAQNVGDTASPKRFTLLANDGLITISGQSAVIEPDPLGVLAMTDLPSSADQFPIKIAGSDFFVQRQSIVFAPRAGVDVSGSDGSLCWQSAQVGQIRTREGYYYEELRGSSLRVLL